MRISDVLRTKGTQVVTVTPDTTVRQLLAVLAENRIGAVIVSGDGRSVEGRTQQPLRLRAGAQPQKQGAAEKERDKVTHGVCASGSQTLLIAECLYEDQDRLACYLLASSSTETGE